MRQTTQRFEAELAKAVSLIVAASHAAAVDAVNEAFDRHQPVRERTPRAEKRGQSSSTRAPSSPKRSVLEIARLEQEVLDAVWANPGAAIATLAAHLGVSWSSLRVPVKRLKEAGRLRTVGSRQFTRYFPVERGGDGDAEAPGR